MQRDDDVQTGQAKAKPWVFHFFTSSQMYDAAAGDAGAEIARDQ